MKFTTFEKTEILNSIQVRIDTIGEDSESATPFEAKGNLEELMNKIITCNGELSHAEIEWLIEEANELLSKCEHNASIDDTAKRDLVKCKNLITKLNKQ